MLQIDELQIRIPNITEDEGSTLGKQVANKVAAAIPDNFENRNIPEIKVQLSDSITKDKNLLADRIAEQIIRQIIPM